MSVIVIGGDQNLAKQAMSAIVYYKRSPIIQQYISYNDLIYWLHPRFFPNVNIWVMKDSENGHLLTQMLVDHSVDDETILRFIDSLALKHISFDDFLSEIDRLKDKSFRLGQQQVRQEFLNLLGINDH